MVAGLCPCAPQGRTSPLTREMLRPFGLRSLASALLGCQAGRSRCAWPLVECARAGRNFAGHCSTPGNGLGIIPLATASWAAPGSAAGDQRGTGRADFRGVPGRSLVTAFSEAFDADLTRSLATLWCALVLEQSHGSARGLLCNPCFLTAPMAAVSAPACARIHAVRVLMPR